MGRGSRGAGPGRSDARGPHSGSDSATSSTRVRLDKWLWAARFFKTRALSMEAIDRGRILVGQQVAKPSREVRLGDEIEIREAGGLSRIVEVRGLSDIRGPAPVAQQLYAETEASRAAREAAIRQKARLLERRAAAQRGQELRGERPREQAGEGHGGRDARRDARRGAR